jgi:hypothetical protein
MRAGAAALVLAIVVLSGCGGSSHTSSQANLSPLESVRQAATKTAGKTSEHLALKGSVTVNGQPVLVSGKGDFKSRSGTMTLDFNVGPLSGTLDAVVDGNTLYVKSPLFTGSVPAGKPWVKIDLAKTASAGGLPLSTVAAQDPAGTLKQLKALSGVTKIGSEQVGGVDATHYRGRVPKTTAHPGAAYDVWIGNDDGYVHRVSFRSLVAPKERLATTIDLSDFGKSVTVNVPPASQTADAANLNISGLLGG